MFMWDWGGRGSKVRYTANGKTTQDFYGLQLYQGKKLR